LFLLVGLGLVVALRVLRRRLDTRQVAGLFVALGLFTLLLGPGRINQYVAFILALGVGVQFARLIRAREKSLLPFLRRSLGFLFGTAIIAGSAGAMWADWKESYQSRQLPAAPANAPNVLLITLDTLRADHVGAYGYSRPTTPNIDRLAGRGVLFEQAMANSSWTLPAHASLFTGRYPHEHGASWRVPLNGAGRTLAEALAGSGYRTAGFSANTSYVSPEWGLGRGFARFDVYGGAWADYLVRTALGTKIAKVVLPRFGFWDIPGRKRAEQVNHEFLRWLDGADGHPFFAFLNFMDVHDPYLIGAPYLTKFSKEVPRGDVINFQFQPDQFRRKPVLSAKEIEAEINGYDGCLAYLDEQIGALLEELERRGLADNTLVILTSDHGEAFGIHDLFGHGNSLYLETLHVPLIFVWPGKVPAGVRIHEVAGLHQIPATVMELLEWGNRTPFPGESLSKQWTAKQVTPPEAAVVIAEVGRNAEGPPAYPTTRGNLKSLITDRWHLIVSDSGEVGLYAWRDDPKELRNLAQTEQGRATVKQLAAQFGTLVGSH